MKVDPLDVQAFAVVVALLVVLYFWIRRNQARQKEVRRMKVRCRDLILDNRHALAAAGVDIEGLVNLVRMRITCEQLDEVIKLLTRPRRHYNIDDMDDPNYLEIDLDIEGRPRKSRAEQAEQAAPEAEEPLTVADSGDAGEQPAAAVSTEVPEGTAIPEGMKPEEEKAWLDLAHKRFRDALAKRGISDRRARLRVLVKMVELGKAAVDNAQDKPFARKEYERTLWDKFYENEYLALNLD